MAPFSFALLRSGRRVVLTAVGEIDGSMIDDFLELADIALVDDTCEALTVDLAAITFLDSTGIGALLAIRNNALNLGKSLSLRHVPPNVLRLLAMTGLDTLFVIDEAATPTAPSPTA